MRSPAKLEDVARAAGVHPATVSRILNRSPGFERLSQPCIDKVEAAARSLAYHPDKRASRLRGKRVDSIGVIMPAGSSSAFAASLFAALDIAVRKRGIHLVLIGGSQPAETATAFFLEKRIDGVVTPHFFLKAVECQTLLQSGVPLVLTHAPRRTQECPAVAVNLKSGLQEIVHHLSGLGHHQLLWVGPLERDHPDASHRRRTFEAAAAKAGLETEARQVTPIGEVALAQYLVLTTGELVPLLASTRSTAAVAYHDVIALAILAAARKVGRRVPENLAVVGIDDVYGEVADPSLTSLNHNANAIADAAITALLDLAASPGAVTEFTGSPVLIEPQLVIRASTQT